MTPLPHFDIRLKPHELDQIANLLAQQPWHTVNALLANIKDQVEYQQKAAAEPQVGVVPVPRAATAFGPNGETEQAYVNGHTQA